MGRLVEKVADAKLYVEERGGEPSAFPLLVFAWRPGLDHTWFADYLDPLTKGGSYRLVLADERACGAVGPDGTARKRGPLERMAQDVSDLAASPGVARWIRTSRPFLRRLLVLQRARGSPGSCRARVVSAGIAAARWLGEIRSATGGVRTDRAPRAGDVVVARETEVRPRRRRAR